MITEIIWYRFRKKQEGSKTIYDWNYKYIKKPQSMTSKEAIDDYFEEFIEYEKGENFYNYEYEEVLANNVPKKVLTHYLKNYNMKIDTLNRQKLYIESLIKKR